MSRCGEPYPENPALLCEAADTPHATHTAVDMSTSPPSGIDWENPDFVVAVKVRTRSQREEHKRSVRDRVSEYNGGPPADIAHAWQERRPVWLAEAKRVLHRYCQEHDQPFTTPEDIWPLLDAEGVDLRIMSLVVQHGVRKRWMTGTGDFRRMIGVYHTRDGVPFQANKPVERYVSRIAIPRD